MNIKNFFELVKKYSIILITMPIIVISFVYVLNKYVIPPKYQAQNQLLISVQSEENSQNLDDLRTSIQLLGTVSAIAQSNKTMEEVSKRLDLKRIEEKISVSTNENSLIMNLNASGSDKSKTIKVVNMFGEVVSEETSKLFSGMQIIILEKATQTSESSIVFQLILAGILGELSAISLIIIVIKSNLLLKNDEQINDLGLKVLGEVAEVEL